jgi:hypothetical protein
MKVGYHEERPGYEPVPPKDSWMSKTPGELSDEELGFLNTYIATRSCPAGDQAAEEAAVSKTLATFIEVPSPLPDGIKEEIRICSRIAGEEVRRSIPRSFFERFDAHVSMSNRSCWEVKSKDGGKTAFILEEFHHRWLQETPVSDETIILPTGIELKFRGYAPRWQAEIAGVDDVDIARDFAEEIQSTGWFHAERNGCDSQRLSTLLFCWAYEYLRSREYLTDEGCPTGKPPPSKMISVGEPGGKVRIPTLTMCAWVTYLQPYAHVMRGLLENDPTLTSGLSAGAQAFEFAKRFEGIDASLMEGILLGDLEESTNYIEHELGDVHMQAFLEGLDINLTPYMRNAHKLCLTPVDIHYDGDVWTTCKGAPMGFPGTKIILHSLAKAIEVKASGRRESYSLRDLKQHRFAVAGDDIMKLGCIAELEQHKEAARFYRVKPSEDKWGIYKVGGPFCEVMVSMHGIITSRPDLVKRSFVIDSPRGRLFSPEGRPRTSDDDTNPIFGKGAALSKELTWFRGNKELYHMVFRNNFVDFGKHKSLEGLPYALGGWQFYSNPEESYRLVDPRIRKLALARVMEQDSHEGARLHRRLRRLSRPTLLERGTAKSDVDVDHPLGDLIRDFSWELDDIIAANEISIPPQAKHWDKVKRVKANGFSSANEFLSRPHRGFYWEKEMKNKPAWQTSPPEVRIQDAVKDMDLDTLKDPTLEEWTELLKTRPRDLIERDCYFKPEDLVVLVEGAGIPLNPWGKDAGFSLSMRLSNQAFIYRL